MSEKLTISHLAPYLPYRLKVSAKTRHDFDEHIGTMCEITHNSNHGDWIKVFFDDVYRFINTNTYAEGASNMHYFFIEQDVIKPLLIPLSQLTDEQWIEVFKAGFYDGDFDHSTQLSGLKIDDADTQILYRGIVIRFKKSELSFHHWPIRFNQLEAFQKIYSLHGDIHGLIEKGLAVNKLTAI